MKKIFKIASANFFRHSFGWAFKMPDITTKRPAQLRAGSFYFCFVFIIDLS